VNAVLSRLLTEAAFLHLGMQCGFLCQVVFQDFCEASKIYLVGLFTLELRTMLNLRVDLFAPFAHDLRSRITPDA
jgi:hypothetical protein